MKYCLYLLFLTLLSPFNLTRAQNRNTSPKKRCPIRTINYENGLLNNATNKIITDALGFTWVSTKTGLQRFNGYSLQTITPVAGNDTFNINSPVYFLELKNGVIWISFKQNVLQYDPVSNSFKQLITLQKNSDFLFDIIPLKQTHEGIWCIQKGMGIVLYDTRGVLLKKFSFLEPAVFDDIINSQDFLSTIIIATNEAFIFIKTRHKSMIRINTQKEECGIMSFGEDILGFACTQDKLFITSDQHLSSFTVPGGYQEKQVNIWEINKENIGNSGVHVLKDNRLLVSINNHLYEFDTLCNYKTEITDLNRNPVISTGFTSHIYTDKFERIWLLTNNDIKRIENIRTPFEHFIYPDTKNNFVRALYYDEQKHLLIAGCLNGGIQIYDTLANPLWKSSLITPEAKDILSIEKLTSDEYLLITYGRGWQLLNLASRKIKPFILPPELDSKIQPGQVNFGNNIQRINNNTLYISTYINVFKCIFSGSKLLSAEALLPFNSIGRNSINCCFYTSDKTLLAGTLSGNLYCVTENKNLQTIHIPENYTIRSITEDMTHNIWIGTDEGLYAYSRSGELIRKITKSTGLLNDCIYSLLPVNQNSVFAASNLGLSYVSLNDSINNFSKEMGLQENEFNTGAALKFPNGKLYFGGVNGITAFYPASLSIINDTPFLYITKLIVSDSLYNPSAGIWKGDTISLNYKQNRLRFDLVAIGLLNTNEYIYQYRMKDYENQWQTTYEPTGINYTLQPGKYTLEVICHPILSPDKSFYKKFFITIDPPWWQTWWFRALAVFVLVAIITLIIHQYNRRRYLKRIRLLQTQQQIQSERERISRDLHDNLGAYASAIASDVENIHDISVSDKTLLENLKANASEIMTSLRDTIWVLHNKVITATGISDRFKNYIGKIQPAYPGKKIVLNENIQADQSLSPTVALNLYRIMQEALHNAIKHSGGDLININLNANHALHISVSDNGKGFSPGENGYGLQNMRSRAKEVSLIFSIEKNEPFGTIINISTG